MFNNKCALVPNSFQNTNNHELINELLENERFGGIAEAEDILSNSLEGDDGKIYLPESALDKFANRARNIANKFGSKKDTRQFISYNRRADKLEDSEFHNRCLEVNNIFSSIDLALKNNTLFAKLGPLEMGIVRFCLQSSFPEIMAGFNSFQTIRSLTSKF